MCFNPYIDDSELKKKVKSSEIIFAFIFAISFVFLILTTLTVREQQKKLYELEQRIYYIEDVVSLWIYGPINIDDKQVDFDNY